MKYPFLFFHRVWRLLIIKYTYTLASINYFIKYLNTYLFGIFCKSSYACFSFKLEQQSIESHPIRSPTSNEKINIFNKISNL